MMGYRYLTALKRATRDQSVSLRTALLVIGIRPSLLILDRLVLLVTLAHHHVNELLDSGLVGKIGNVLAGADSSELHDGETSRDAAVTLVLSSLGDFAGQDITAEVWLGAQGTSESDHCKESKRSVYLVSDTKVR